MTVLLNEEWQVNYATCNDFNYVDIDQRTIISSAIIIKVCKNNFCSTATRHVLPKLLSSRNIMSGEKHKLIFNINVDNFLLFNRFVPNAPFLSPLTAF